MPRPEPRRSSSSLSAMVIEREREIRGLHERLVEANERHDRSIASLEAVSSKLEEIQSQARGQATRIRMKALREAVEVGRRAQELTEAQAGAAPPSANGWTEQRGRARRPRPLRGHRQSRDRPPRRLLPAGRLRGRRGPDRRHLRDLGRALHRGPGDDLYAAERAGRAPPRARGALAARLPGPAHGGGQPDPRRRRRPGPRAARRVAELRPAASRQTPPLPFVSRRPGGVATQRPAKPFTPVRFRWAPLFVYRGIPFMRE